jgi:hypothetical protein
MDTSGNVATATQKVTVTYGLEALFDDTKPHKSGSVVSIKLEVTAADGTDLSSASLPVTAVGIAPASSDTPTIKPAPSPGNSYRGGLFTYDPTVGGTGGYTFNLKTTGLKPGVYKLFFTIGDDLTLHYVEFVVR